MAKPPEITVLLLGDSGCGKSTFLSRISHGNAKSDRLSLLSDLDQPFTYDVRLLSKPYRLHFYDTSSPIQWTMLNPDVVVLCFSISSRQSLINMQRIWMKEIETHFNFDKDFIEKDIPVLILGLKLDLRSQGDSNSTVSSQESHKITLEMRCDKYMECSAVTGEFVQRAFEDICKTAVMTLTQAEESEGWCTAM